MWVADINLNPYKYYTYIPDVYKYPKNMLRSSGTATEMSIFFSINETDHCPMTNVFNSSAKCIQEVHDCETRSLPGSAINTVMYG